MPPLEIKERRKNNYGEVADALGRLFHLKRDKEVVLDQPGEGHMLRTHLDHCMRHTR